MKRETNIAELYCLLIAYIQAKILLLEYTYSVQDKEGANKPSKF